MLQANVVQLNSVHERLKKEVYKLYMNSQAKPMDISRKYNIPLDTVRGWIRDEGWDHERAANKVDEMADRLSQINIAQADEVARKMYKMLIKIVDQLQVMIDEKLGNNRLDGLVKILEVLKRAEQLDEQLLKRLKIM